MKRSLVLAPSEDPATDAGPALRTEFAFTLPRGYVDAAGTVHRDGVMRLATARDELIPLYDDRVREAPAYLTVVLLARVITRLGTMDHINTRMIESLYAADLAYLQDFYQRINQNGDTRLQVTCPHCDGEFDVEVTRLGE